MDRLARAMLEDTLVGHIQATATQFGWRFAHFRPGRTKDGGWKTAVQGDRGFVDCVIANGERVLFVEAKSELGKLGEGQPEWLEALDNVYETSSQVWRPSDWYGDKIIKELRR